MCAFVRVCAFVCLGVLYICDVNMCACMFVHVCVCICRYVYICVNIYDVEVCMYMHVNM